MNSTETNATFEDLEMQDSLPDAAIAPHAESNSVENVLTDVSVQPVLEPQDTAPSVASDTCSVLFEMFDIQFQDPADAHRTMQFTSEVLVLTCVFLMSSAISFFSSSHIHTASQIDVVLNSSDLAAIDCVSAIMVIGGFVGTYIHNSMRVEEFKDLAYLVWLLLMVDVWLATVVSVVAGSVFHLIHHSFSGRDIALTWLEGLSGLRVLEWHQGSNAWHSYNVSAWPIMCIAWSFVLLPFTVAGNAWIAKRFPSVGHLLILLNACLPVVVLTIFAFLRDDTNIFFANASSLGYRLLEFNFGVCLFHFMHTRSDVTTRVLFVLNRAAGGVALVFALVWLSQIGGNATPASDTCVRMYYFARCIRVHHAMLMRGCLLGVTGIACIVVPGGLVIPDAPLTLLPVLASAVVFLWPLCYVLTLLMQINFSAELIQENISLIVFIMPVAALCVAYLWNQTLKIRCFQVAEQQLGRAWQKLAAARARVIGR